MNRRILIQVTTPGAIIGLLLFGACLASAWYIDRLQSNMAMILVRNVTSLQAAEELEIRVQQLRFHSFLNLINPKEDRKKAIEEDYGRFEAALALAAKSAHSPEEHDLVKDIKIEYQRYLRDLEQMQAEVKQKGARTDFGQLADTHPIKRVIEPCEKLLALNTEMMHRTSEDNDRLSRQVEFLMIFLGIVGPVSGLLVGFAVARGLSRSIYQLSVRVQDMAQRLDQDVAAVNIQADGDVASLDRQLQHVVGKVEEVAGRLQRHQRELLRAEQLSAVGQLAASVAHEVRNPLTSVKMLVEAALRTRNPQPLSANDLKVIHGEIARLERTVQTFLDFARMPTPKKSWGDLREVVAQAVELIQVRACRQEVEVDTLCPDQPVRANVDRDQFCNVLVNLLLNALDAMPNGGRLEIALGPSPSPLVGDGRGEGVRLAPTPHPHPLSPKGREGNGGDAAPAIRLAIADNGAGIPPEMAGRLFTPFASSKPTGTGLGLSICRRIVEEHGGEISAFNRPEGGACFVIILPARQALRMERRAEQEQLPLPS